MPTEHEYKYLISLDLLKEFNENNLPNCWQRGKLEQGYICHGLGSIVRIRHLTLNNLSEWYLTLKMKDDNRLIEIENKVDDRDGNALWSKSYWQVTKTRYVHALDGIFWEIDFFKKDESIYFILAEVELDEGSPRPNKIPDFLQKYLVHEVDLTDSRFSNTRLGNKEHAQSLYLNYCQGVTNG